MQGPAVKLSQLKEAYQTAARAANIDVEYGHGDRGRTGTSIIPRSDASPWFWIKINASAYDEDNTYPTFWYSWFPQTNGPIDFPPTSEYVPMSLSDGADNYPVPGVSIPAIEINQNDGVPADTYVLAWYSDAGDCLLFDYGSPNVTGGTINYTNVTINYNGTTTINYGGNTTVIFNGAIFFPGYTYTTITTNINNVSLTGIGNARLRVSSDAHYREITGIAPGTPSDGRVVCLHNVGDYVIIIPNDSGNSTAANRILTTTGNVYFLAPDHEVTLWYDAAASRWRVSENSDERLGAVETYGSWGSNQTDWSVSPYAEFHRVTSSSDVELTGIARPKPGLRHRIANIGSYVITLTHEDATSSAVNRFSLPREANLNIQPNGCVEVVYDGTTERWRVIAYRDVFVEKQSVYGGVEGIPTSSADWTREAEGVVQQTRANDTEHPELALVRSLSGGSNLAGGEVVGAVRGYGTVDGNDNESLGSFQIVYAGTGSQSDGRAEIYGADDGVLTLGFTVHENGQGEFDTANTPNYLLGTDGLGRVIVVDPDGIGGGGGSGGGLAWVKVTKTYTDLAAASDESTIDLYELQAAQALHAIALYVTTPFTGGTITDYDLSVIFDNIILGDTYLIDAVPSETASPLGFGLWPNNVYATGFPDPHIASMTTTKMLSLRANVLPFTAETNEATAGVVDVYILVSALDGGGGGGGSELIVSGADTVGDPISIDPTTELVFHEDDFTVEETSTGVAEVRTAPGAIGVVQLNSDIYAFITAYG